MGRGSAAVAQRMREAKVAELLTYIICEMAGGIPGKCDPHKSCVCGGEGETISRILYERGFVVMDVDLDTEH